MSYVIELLSVIYIVNISISQMFSWLFDVDECIILGAV